MEKKHFGELSNLLTGIKGETIGKPGDQGSVYPPWEGLISTSCRFVFHGSPEVYLLSPDV